MNIAILTDDEVDKSTKQYAQKINRTKYAERKEEQQNEHFVFICKITRFPLD